MLFDKTATLYTKSKNASMVTSRTSAGTFSCNIQPAGDMTGMGGIPAYNNYNMFTETMTVKEGDKVTCSGETYVVRGADERRGVFRTYLAVTMEKSRGS